jgi:lysophospholipase L1-like esterase
MTTRSKWIALFAVMFVAIALLLVFAEGAIRVRQYILYGQVTSLESIYRMDEATHLRVLVPNAHKGPIHVNSLGFRGPDIPERKPANRIRIAFLGASTNFCAEVSSDEVVWTNVVVERLRQRYPGVDFDFVNAGVPGYSVESSLKSFQYFVSRLGPDLVVVYHGTNDLSYEARKLAQERGLMKSPRVGGQGWLEDHSLLWELVVKNLRLLAAQRGAESMQGRLVVDGASLGGEFRSDLGSLVDEAHKTGAAVALATFSTRIRAEQSVDEKKKAAVSALVYMPFMSLDGLLTGYNRYNEVIREVAKEKGAWLIAGETDIPGDAAHFVDTVHFTDAGSRAMGERVAGALIAEPRFDRLVESRRRRAP